MTAPTVAELAAHVVATGAQAALLERLAQLRAVPEPPGLQVLEGWVWTLPAGTATVEALARGLEWASAAALLACRTDSGAYELWRAVEDAIALALRAAEQARDGEVTAAWRALADARGRALEAWSGREPDSDAFLAAVAEVHRACGALRALGIEPRAGTNTDTEDNQ